jgi:hypothetical protein
MFESDSGESDSGAGGKKKQGFVARILLSLSPGYEFNLPFERPGVGSDGGPRR